jgi:hypothetical protein
MHILRFLNFSDKNDPEKMDKNYDRLLKMRTIFDEPSVTYIEHYSPTEHLGIDEVIVLFKGYKTLLFQFVKCRCVFVSAMNPMSMQNLVTLAAMTGANGASLQVSPTGKFLTVFSLRHICDVCAIGCDTFYCTHTYHKHLILTRSFIGVSMFWEIFVTENATVYMTFFLLYLL